MKIVINSRFGGFGLSREGMVRYGELKGIKLWPELGKFDLWTYWTTPPEERLEVKEGKDFYSMSDEDRRSYNATWSTQTLYSRQIDRGDPALVQAVEELGKKADGQHAALKIVDIPDGIEWDIMEYDGMEHVAQKHQTWS